VLPVYQDRQLLERGNVMLFDTLVDQLVGNKLSWTVAYDSEARCLAITVVTPDGEVTIGLYPNHRYTVADNDNGDTGEWQSLIV
jgi:hypothetical protein